MLENQLMALLRSTLMADSRLAGVAVDRKLPLDAIGAPKVPTVFTQQIGTARYGFLKREYLPLPEPAETMLYRETQYMETTVQVSATARRKPVDEAFPTAFDICRAASDILQGDAALATLAAQNVRPGRITNIRDVPFLNESAQNEDNPSFDVVLHHVQITESTTTPPVAVFEPKIGRV